MMSRADSMIRVLKINFDYREGEAVVDILLLLIEKM